MPIQHHISRAAEKLRHQSSLTGRVGVWLETNRFRPQDKQYHPFKSQRLPCPTDDTALLSRCATQLLSTIWQPDYRFVKAGVMLDDIRPSDMAQGDLFATSPHQSLSERTRLMALIDQANRRWGGHTLGIGYGGIKEKGGWIMKRSMKSPNYTTCWEELRQVTS